MKHDFMKLKEEARKVWKNRDESRSEYIDFCWNLKSSIISEAEEILSVIDEKDLSPVIYEAIESVAKSVYPEDIDYVFDPRSGCDILEFIEHTKKLYMKK